MNYSSYASIHARHIPEKTCLIERTASTGVRRTLTWKEFDDEINRTANFLSKELHVKKDDFIMHLQNNSLEWLITYFAIIRLGAVVVPLNFRFESEDILYAAGVCNPEVFILGDEFLGVVRPIMAAMSSVKHYVCIGENSPEDMIDFQRVTHYEDTLDALVPVTPEHSLAMMFTSGTTGKPKPVLHTHFSINSTAIGNGMSYFVQRNDNYLIFLPLYHSGTLFLWAPFYATGATGTLIREFKDPKYIIEALAEEKCTDTLFVVPVAIAILNAVEKGELDLSRYDLSAWKYMEIGAQPVPFDTLKLLVKHLPCQVSNIYGITEGGGGGLFNLYPEDVLEKPGSIGKPTFAVEAKIVGPLSDEDLAPEEVGELIFKTPRMMAGYYSNPEKTEETLKDGWLYTGDLLKKDADGYYYIVDRMKDMIISGGENIYPVEIEDALMDHPDIDDVACIGYPDDRLVEIVLAVVQLKDGKNISETDIIEFAKSKLSLYKVPRKVIFDAVPRNPTGKLMKPLLREKFTGRKQAFKKLE
ncbi:MAG TPA: AMP-binding protein [Desulfobacteraceae bacterium]|nr:AMP-binding protein [Desulfobacteraceae bacterium]